MFTIGALSRVFSLALYLFVAPKKHRAVLTCCCQVATFASICFVFCAIALPKVCYSHCPPAPTPPGLVSPSISCCTLPAIFELFPWYFDYAFLGPCLRPHVDPISSLHVRGAQQQQQQLRQCQLRRRKREWEWVRGRSGLVQAVGIKAQHAWH